MNKTILLLVLAMLLNLPEMVFAGDYRNLSLTQELVDSGLAIVDIRTEAEWRESGVVAGSVLMTFFKPDHSYDLEGFSAELDRLVDPHKEFAILCRRGDRSARLAALLAERGYNAVINLSGGIRRAELNGVRLVPYPAKNDEFSSR